MKYAILAAIASVAIAAPGWADTAQQLNAQELARLQSGAPGPMPPRLGPPSPMTAAADCPPGMRFVPAGYIKRGKWRPAGCVLVR